jgi:hypothetical protein
MARIARKFLIVVILALAMLEEAAAIFERLGARPWSERVAQLAGRPAQARS